MGEFGTGKDPHNNQTEDDIECNNNYNDEQKTDKLTARDILCLVHLCGGNFSIGLYYAMLGPFFPQEAAAKGMSPSLTGIAICAFEFVTIVTSPIIGAYLTTLGQKRTYIFGLILGSFASVAFGALQYCPGGTPFKVLSILIRLLGGLGTSAYTTSSFSITGTLFPKSLSSAMAFLQMCLGIGLMLGPPIGGFLYKFGGFLLPFVLVGVASFFFALASFCILPSEKLKLVAEQKSKQLMWPLLRIPLVLVMAFCLASGLASITFLDVALALRLQSVYDFTPSTIGLIFLIGPGFYCIMSLFWGCIADKKPRWNIIFTIVGYLVAGISYTFLGPVPFIPIPDDMLWLVMLTLMTSSAGISTFVVSFQVMSSAAVKGGLPDTSETFGAVSGLLASSISLGAFAGPFLGGYLVQSIEFQWSAFVFACIMICYALVAIIYVSVECPCVEQQVKRHNKVKDVQKPSETQRLMEKTHQ